MLATALRFPSIDCWNVNSSYHVYIALRAGTLARGAYQLAVHVLTLHHAFLTYTISMDHASPYQHTRRDGATRFFLIIITIHPPDPYYIRNTSIAINCNRVLLEDGPGSRNNTTLRQK